MTKRDKKFVNFDVMVEFFLRHYKIPTKKDIDKVIERMDRLEHLVKTIAKSGQGKRSSGKISGKPKTSQGDGEITAADVVLGIIKNAKDEGIAFADIKEKTGFEEKKLRNVIFRLSKTGRIQSRGRGIYVIGHL